MKRLELRGDTHRGMREAQQTDVTASQGVSHLLRQTQYRGIRTISLLLYVSHSLPVAPNSLRWIDLANI